MKSDIQGNIQQEELASLTSNALTLRPRAALGAIRRLGALRFILALALLEGLVCFIVIPPWWHNDEPAHFEYVWLAAHSPTWPVEGQYNQSMRKELALSLIKYGWYAIRNYKPDLNTSQPIWINTPQTGDKPGYYFLASLPLRLIPNAPIIVQYFAARSVSLLLYLLIIVAVWYGLGEILPGNHPLRWMTSVFVATLPAFADEMSSVNNDVSAVLAASLFLWASLRLIRRGYSIGRLAFLAASLIACYLTKSTALFSFVLTPLVLILAFLKGRFTPWVWGVVGAGMIALAALVLQWGGALAWYQSPPGQPPVRVETKDARVGRYAFALDDSGPKGSINDIVQIMPPDEVQPLIGKTMTLGAWIWSDQPTKTMRPVIVFFVGKGQLALTPASPVNVTTVPTFYSVTFTVPKNVDHAMIRARLFANGIPHNHVYYDGLVLVPGSFQGIAPWFADASGAHGMWNRQKFDNVIRNGSAEQASFQIRSWPGNGALANSLAQSMINPYLVLTTIQDWAGLGRYDLAVVGTMFRTFWASLAGDKAFLRSSAVTGFLQVFTIAGVVGMPVGLWRRRKTLRWDIIGFLGLALLLPWAIAVARGPSTFLGSLFVFPLARYAYPGILSTTLFLCAGWLTWLEILSGPLKLDTTSVKGVFLGIMAGIAVFAFLNAIEVLHRQWWDGWVSLLLLILLQYTVFHWAMRRRSPSDLSAGPSGS